jgi:hypothetical protein
MKGQILDVYPDGKEAFRACVIDVLDNQFEGGEQGVLVVCLKTGDNTIRHHWECENPVIENIFDVTESEEEV